MNTKLLYLDDTYLMQGQGCVQAISQDDIGPFIKFEATLFYPRGGGQESDLGQLVSSTGGTTQVVDVRFVDGQVLHYVDSASNLMLDEIVTTQIDGARRLINSANHTGGHLICGLLTQRFEDLNPVKGYHFSNGAYIEFDGVVHVDHQSLAEWLQLAVESAINSSWPVMTQLVNYETLKELCSFIPTGLPNNKPLRIVTVGNLEPLPCGGTHLKNIGEIQNINIRKVKNNRGVLRVSYETQLS